MSGNRETVVTVRLSVMYMIETVSLNLARSYDTHCSSYSHLLDEEEQGGR